MFEKSTARGGWLRSFCSAIADRVLPPSETRGKITEKLRDFESIAKPEMWLVSSEVRTMKVLQIAASKLGTAN
jgi:hypothetical protein